MINNPGIGNLKSLLTLIKPPEKGLSLKAGSIIKAQVIDVTDKGESVLRLASSGGETGAVIKAQSDIPLTKGQNIFLEIVGGKGNVTMRIAGSPGSTPEALPQNVPVKLLDMLAKLSDMRACNKEFQELLNMLKSLPQNVKTAIPGMKNLHALLLDMKQIDGKLLKAFIENSGVAFETRLRIAALSDPGSLFQNLMTLQAEGDLKALLLRLRSMLKDRSIIHALKQSGISVSDVSGPVERFISNIEFYQVTSKLNDMLYTFLPLLWDDLKDGELLFKKHRQQNREAYTCDINLDIKSMGKLSVSVTIMDSCFFLTFVTEKQEVRDLIQSQKHLLEKRFASQGLPLKAINLNYKKNITFGRPQGQGINVKI